MGFLLLHTCWQPACRAPERLGPKEGELTGKQQLTVSRRLTMGLVRQPVRRDTWEWCQLIGWRRGPTQQ